MAREKKRKTYQYGNGTLERCRNKVRKFLFDIGNGDLVDPDPDQRPLNERRLLAVRSGDVWGVRSLQT
jgi:hypothetical protein